MIPLSNSQLILRYGAFAVIASAANLATQRAVLSAATTKGEPAAYGLALICGTAMGLLLKYVLDKRWIFHDAVQPARAETRKLWRYTLTGIGTTLLFWGTETGFWLIWRNDLMREIGAVLGLTAGYIVKYRLDKRFVFAAPAGSQRQ